MNNLSIFTNFSMSISEEVENVYIDFNKIYSVVEYYKSKYEEVPESITEMNGFNTSDIPVIAAFRNLFITRADIDSCSNFLFY